MMKSKLIEKWMREGLRPSSFEFFTRRENLVLGKLPGRQALVEYICPSCKFYEIKTVEMVREKKKFRRPRFKCSNCGKSIVVRDLRKLPV